MNNISYQNESLNPPEIRINIPTTSQKSSRNYETLMVILIFVLPFVYGLVIVINEEKKEGMFYNVIVVDTLIWFILSADFIWFFSYNVYYCQRWMIFFFALSVKFVAHCIYYFENDDKNKYAESSQIYYFLNFWFIAMATLVILTIIAIFLIYEFVSCLNNCRKEK